MPTIRPRISESEIAVAVSALGSRISSELEGRDVTILGVLTGSVVFVADLMRQITVPHQLGLIQASSYLGKTTTSGELRMNLDFLPEIRNRDVLLVDDIFDTGKTLLGIQTRLHEFQPRSIRTAVLLWKKSRTCVELVPDYFCFDIPDEFVVGYGLDYDGQYRHLPFIGVVEGLE